MKPLLFISITSACIYAALRWDIAAYTMFGLFLFSASFLIFYSIYRHLATTHF